MYKEHLNGFREFYVIQSYSSSLSLFSLRKYLSKQKHFISDMKMFT